MSNIGNFFTYIYIPVKCNKITKQKSKACFDTLLNLIEKQLIIYNSQELSTLFGDSPNGRINKEEISKYIYYQLDKLNIHHQKNDNIQNKCFENELHITIVDLVHIKEYMIESFISKIRKELKNQNSFYLFFNNEVDLYKSQNYSKFFCAYTVNEEDQELHLNSLINKINNLLTQFGLSNNFVNRNCHVSLAYTNIDLTKLLKKEKLSIDQTCWFNINKIIKEDSEVEREINTDIISSNTTFISCDDFYIYVNCICVRIGKKIYKIPFKSYNDKLLSIHSDDSYITSSDD
ncbi:U6 snRNA phosphodiesterase, putative [Hepatocystis sp. ex Piliocolobus tephrosceles]|nr:U6 snRNA phosphodiesterase, putative [Hepatocystis sp. ex Piliocolobus tephrosceles]